MSLVPEFELGLWNAWIFMGPFLLVTLLLMLLMMKKGGPGGSVRAVQRACMYACMHKSCARAYV